MRVGKLCRLALRFWLGFILVLGFSSHYYSPTRRRLVHSRILLTFDWLLMAINLVAFYAYYSYAMTYFLEATFRRQGFVMQVSTCNVFQQLMMTVTNVIWHLLFEREACETYNEVSRILEQDLKLKEHSRFYCLAFLAKVLNFLHNMNFGLSAIIHWGLRPFNFWDLLANLYFVYNSLARDAVQVAYVLLLLNLSEALRLNGQQEHGSYSGLMQLLRRQERLLAIGWRVHRMFAWLVAMALFYLVFFNTATIYLGYTVFTQRHDALGLHARGWKLLLMVVSFLVILWDVLLLQIVCEKLLAEENQMCASPKDVASSRTTYKQWEMSVLRRAIRRASPENNVLGMFRMDMRCAFALISCSVSYGIIIIQIGYIPS
ncbi:putative gustatory receptor 10b [Drosophila teissieri]|uniref:putative gustatory receptor 10b n=1 Tax=Drosophila teissieri TaxID=7243 RepID=UPI001CBA05CB|nr:putative gustatory receptor 10b [Drosophila teissieri]